MSLEALWLLPFLLCLSSSINSLFQIFHFADVKTFIASLIFSLFPLYDAIIAVNKTLIGSAE